MSLGPSGGGAGSGISRWRSPRAPWFAFAGVLIVAFGFLIWEGRGNTFFYDEWTWIEYRRSGLHSILASYNDHFLPLPIAVYQVLLHTVGMTHYAVYRVLVAASHLSCVALVFEFARRRVGPAALLLAAPLAFLGSGWEYELWGLNFAFTGALALGIAAVLALDRPSGRADVRACALLTLGLLFSEFVVLFAVGIAVATVIGGRGFRRIWVSVLPLAIYGAWWVVYYEPVGGGGSLTQAPKFAADMAASAAGGLFGAGLSTGRLVLVAIVVLVLWRVIGRRTVTPALMVVAVTAIAFWSLVAIGRTGLGVPSTPHYVYTGAVLVALIVAESLRGTRLPLKLLAPACGLTALALVGNIQAYAGGETELRSASRTVTAGLGALELAGPAAPPSLVLDPHYAPQIVAGVYWAARRALGSSPADSPAALAREPEFARSSADAVLVRAGELVVAQGAAAVGGPPPVVAAGGGPWRAQRSCVTFGARGTHSALQLLLPAPGIELRPSPGPAVQVLARRFAAGFGGAPITAPAGGSTAIIRGRPDGARAPWRLRISTAQPVRACTIA